MTTSVLGKEKVVAKVPIYAWVIVVVVMLVGVAAPIARIKVSPLMDTLKQFFALSNTQSGFLMGLYSFTGIFLAIPAGLVISKLGLKRTGVIAAACVTLGCALGAIAPSFNVLMVSRVLEGLSMALIGVVGPAAIALWFTKEHRGVPLAIWSLWVPLGSTIGMNTVPQLLKASTWQTVYWLNAGVGLIAFIFFLIFYRNPRKDETAVPALTKEQEIAEKANIFKDLAGALKIKDVWLIFGCMTCFSLGMGVFQAFGMTYLRNIVGATPPRAAFITSLQFIVCALLAWAVGLLSDKLGTRKKILFVGYVIYMLSLFLWPVLNLNVQMVFFSLIGVAAAILPPMIYTSMPEALSDNRVYIAAGMAMIATGQGIGNFLGPTIGGYMADNFGWAWVAYWLIPVFLVGMFLTSRLKVK
jgi:MFS family permease